MEGLEIELDERDEEFVGLTKCTGVRVIWVDRMLNRRRVLGILKSIWLERIAPYIKEMGINKYAISFEKEEDLEKVIEEGPWLVMGHYFNLKRWKTRIEIDELDLEVGHFWIQIHNLPLEMLTEANGEIIGKCLGEVIRVENSIEKRGLCKGYLRIRITIKMEKPLVGGFCVPRRGNGRFWAAVKYEKLADFCYNCGRLGHVQKNYEKKENKGIKTVYGEHMRAGGRKF
ncbi:hypothetical protein DITRI_Ditri03aG0017000 [Diplodiscus trichospermus]